MIDSFFKNYDKNILFTIGAIVVVASSVVLFLLIKYRKPEMADVRNKPEIIQEKGPKVKMKNVSSKNNGGDGISYEGDNELELEDVETEGNVQEGIKIKPSK